MASGSLPPKDEVEKALSALRKNYIASWPGKHERILEYFGKIKEGQDDQEGLKTLRLEFHKLAGTGTTYNLPGVTKSAREAEEIVVEYLENEQTLSGESVSQVQGLIHALDELFRNNSET